MFGKNITYLNIKKKINTSSDYSTTEIILKFHHSEHNTVYFCYKIVYLPTNFLSLTIYEMWNCRFAQCREINFI